MSFPDRSPLQQLLNNKVHGEMLSNFDAQWQQRFKEVREFLGNTLADLDLTPYGRLDNGEWLCDEIMSECIQSFQQGMPVPVSDVSNHCERKDIEWCMQAQQGDGSQTAG